jgi:hypothetical protein
MVPERHGSRVKALGQNGVMPHHQHPLVVRVLHRLHELDQEILIGPDRCPRLWISPFAALMDPQPPLGIDGEQREIIRQLDLHRTGEAVGRKKHPLAEYALHIGLLLPELGSPARLGVVPVVISRDNEGPSWHVGDGIELGAEAGFGLGTARVSGWRQAVAVDVVAQEDRRAVGTCG